MLSYIFSIVIKMKRSIGVSTLLFLLGINGIECRTWRSPRTLSTPSRNSALTFVRGGSSDIPSPDDVPVVPEDTVKNSPGSNLQQCVARGGSTTTRAFKPQTNSLSHPPPLLSSSSSHSALPKNATILETEVVLSKPRPVKEKKHHKRHKHIAKKLKVSDSPCFLRKS